MGNRYLQMDVGTARPEVLVSRLYQKAISSAKLAREGRGDRTQRIRALRQALDIVSELRSSLDFEAGGDIAHNLDRLYEFVSDRLVRAGLEQGDAAIDDVLRVLEPLADSWSQLASGPPVPVPG